MLIKTSFQPPREKEQILSSLGASIIEGLHYVLKHRFLFWITLLLLLVNFILPTSDAQLVFFARRWFAASDSQIGLLYAVGSIGTVFCSLIAGRIGVRRSPGAFALGGLLLAGLCTALPAVAHWYWVLLLCWALRGSGDALFVINLYSLTQSEVPSHLLGRVLTFTRVLTWSTASLGALLGGFAIERTQNVGLVYTIVGLLLVGIALAFFATPLKRAGYADLQTEHADGPG